MAVAHSDVFSWWISVKKEQPPASWNTYFERVRDGMEGADLLIAPSQAMMEYIRNIYQVTTPGKVIYNGRDARTFYPAQKEPFIFSMGRIWDEAKNIRLLMDAAPAIRYPIKLAGDTSFAGNTSQPEQAPITYLGKLPVSGIAAHLSTASVYVLPALYEPFGLSVLEAALSGCALVLGDIGSLREIWGGNALYVDPADAGALADAVNYLMEDEAVRTAYAGKAFEQASRYSARSMAEKYWQAYSWLLQEKSYLLQQETIR
jgi:glycosyltransferase involved in cell wall biosynthesis